MAMYRAYHRWMAEYCSAYPNRLGGVILAGARDIDGALVEIRRWGRANWAWGLMVYAPVGMPLDHPALEPLYAAAAELDLAVIEMELLAAAIIMMRRLSTRLVAGQYVRTEAGTSTR
jgi:predicted TIM-barrel fold metal-dependent hydrolase